LPASYGPKDLVVLIDLCGSPIETYLDTTAGISPLEILFRRVVQLVPAERTVLLAQKKVQNMAILSKFAAEHKTTIVKHLGELPLRRIMLGTAMFRVYDFVRVVGEHPFADPELIGMLHGEHTGKKEKVAYSYFENVPDWAAAEIISTKALTTAYYNPETKDDESYPREFFTSRPDDFTCCRARLRYRGRWPEPGPALDTTESKAVFRQAVSRFSDPVSVSYKQFLS